MKLNIPTWLATALALVAGLIQVLSATGDIRFHQWTPYVTVALVFLAGIGISPLTHAAFRAALHLSLAATTIITALISAATFAVTTLSMSGDARGWLNFVLTVAAGLGFGAATGPAGSPAPPPQPR